MDSSPDFRPNHLRKLVLQMSFRGQSVHVPCAFSIIEVFASLYSKHAQWTAGQPRHPSRDYVVLSKGHGVMAQYACLKEMGFITQNDLDQYFTDGSLLRGLSEDDVPGCEVTSGSLGHGLSVATGIALGLKLKKKPNRVYCIIGDGEMNEGPIWEALLFAAHHKIKNLCVIVDANGFQAMGKTADVLNVDPLQKKFEAFGFETIECDGHDLQKLDQAFTHFKNSKSDQPKALVARTVKGKGVSFMEHNNSWHYTRLTDDTLQQALLEVSK